MPQPRPKRRLRSRSRNGRDRPPRSRSSMPLRTPRRVLSSRLARKPPSSRSRWPQGTRDGQAAEAEGLHGFRGGDLRGRRQERCRDLRHLQGKVDPLYGLSLPDLFLEGPGPPGRSSACPGMRKFVPQAGAGPHPGLAAVARILVRGRYGLRLHPAVLAGSHTGSGRWTRIEDSWVVEQRVGWWAMSRGGEPWRGLLII